MQVFGKREWENSILGGIISSSIMLSGMIILGSIFEETGVDITYVMSFSIYAFLFRYVVEKVDRHNYIKYRRFFVIFEEIKTILEKNWV